MSPVAANAASGPVSLDNYSQDHSDVNPRRNIAKDGVKFLSFSRHVKASFLRARTAPRRTASTYAEMTANGRTTVPENAPQDAPHHIPAPGEPSIPELEEDENIPPRPEEEVADVLRARPDVEDHSRHPE